ncbi:MAG: hypothetical protein M1825_001094 [Sarcosagium campestre]|nr:MAG: hypothetical protein M1825_001094 [Sarcosagium campestre]
MSLPYSKPPSTPTVPVKPFTVSIPEGELASLQTLIRHARLPPATYENGSRRGGKFGVTAEWISAARDAWIDKFDCPKKVLIAEVFVARRKHENHINSFPNYIASITDDKETLDIHFVGLFSEKKQAVPLILLHGWPGSFLEFLPVLSRLKETYSPSDLPYHVIVPSLPGYAFSSGPPLDRDYRLQDVSRILDKLMVGLGFANGYVAQGGDIGSEIARFLAVDHQSSVHLNFCMVPESESTPSVPNELDDKMIERRKAFMFLGRGYAMEHATRPSTIGIVLSSSPIALLAWIGEKFLEWSDVDPPLEKILDHFLEAIQATDLETTTQNVTDQTGRPEDPNYFIRKPFGYSLFPLELFPVPRSHVATTGDLSFFRQHDTGGHFAALEKPEAFLKDIQEFIAESWSKK